MTVKINKRYYTIKFDTLEEERNIGLTLCKISEIRLAKDIDKDLLYSTLIHELVHAYLFEYGMPRETYSQEDMCNFFGAYGKEIIENACKIIKFYDKELNQNE